MRKRTLFYIVAGILFLGLTLLSSCKAKKSMVILKCNCFFQVNSNQYYAAKEVKRTLHKQNKARLKEINKDRLK